MKCRPSISLNTSFGAVVRLFITVMVPAGLSCSPEGFPGSGSIPAYSTSPKTINLPGGDVEVPVSITDHLILVDVYVNGGGPYKFLLDTGSGAAMVTPKVAAASSPDHIQSATATVNSDTGETHPFFQIDSLQMGNVRFENFWAVMMDLSGTFPNFDFQIDGLIGVPLFEAVILTLDYPRRKVRLQLGALPPVDSCAILPTTDGAYDPTGQSFIPPSMSVAVAGRTTQVLIDSGNNAVMNLPSSFSDLPFSTTPVSNTQYTVNGSRTTLSGCINGTLSFGCVRIDNPCVSIVNAQGGGMGGTSWMNTPSPSI